MPLGKPVVPVLVKALTMSNPRIRYNAIETLLLIKDPSAVPSLIPVAKDPNEMPRIREHALRVAVRLDPVLAPPAIEAMVRDQEPAIRKVAAFEARYVRQKVVVQPLIDLLADEERFVAITAIGLYTAYVTPVFLRLRNPDFRPGPWNLGRWSRLVGWTAIAWVVIIVILFVLPVYGPVDAFWPPWEGSNRNLFNFAGPVFLAALVLIGLWWLVSARHWFTGPRVQGSEEELLRIERELAALERGEGLPAPPPAPAPAPGGAGGT